MINYAGEGTYDLSAGQGNSFANYLPDFTSMEAYSSIADNTTGTFTVTEDNDHFAECAFTFTEGFEVDGIFEYLEITECV